MHYNTITPQNSVVFGIIGFLGISSFGSRLHYSNIINRCLVRPEYKFSLNAPQLQPPPRKWITPRKVPIKENPFLSCMLLCENVDLSLITPLFLLHRVKGASNNSIVASDNPLLRLKATMRFPNISSWFVRSLKHQRGSSLSFNFE
jgi:hypothetical protein